MLCARIGNFELSLVLLLLLLLLLLFRLTSAVDKRCTNWALARLVDLSGFLT